MKSPSPLMLKLSLAITLGAFLTSSALAQDSQSKPDNSAQNKNQGMTADNQPNAKADRELAASVRKAIIADKDLSTYAHNIKILVHGGTVTLKGPVKSDDEKQRVKHDAEGVASAGKVIDQLTVKM